MPDFDDVLVELMWSLWAEVGVPGWKRHHREIAVDPEALVVFSAAFFTEEARLRDEAAAWCISFDRLISKTRLRNLARGQRPDVADAFHSFAAALNKRAGLVWPSARSDPMALTPRAREPSQEWASRPAAIVMRLRALMGVGSRAEVVRAFLAYPDASLSAPELAVHVHLARRNVADALEALELAGLLGSVRERSTVRYVLARAEALQTLLGPLPRSFPHWPELFDLLMDLRGLFSARKSTALLRAIEAQKFLERHSFAIARNHLPDPPLVQPGDEVWARLEDWAFTIATRLAHNEADLLTTPRLRPTFVRVRQTRIGRGHEGHQTGRPPVAVRN